MGHLACLSCLFLAHASCPSLTVGEATCRTHKPSFPTVRESFNDENMAQQFAKVFTGERFRCTVIVLKLFYAYMHVNIVKVKSLLQAFTKHRYIAKCATNACVTTGQQSPQQLLVCTVRSQPQLFGLGPDKNERIIKKSDNQDIGQSKFLLLT